MKTDTTPNHRATSRPWQASKPVHLTDRKWSCAIHNGPIIAARAVGVTRAHAVANAAIIIRAVSAFETIMAMQPTEHEELRRLGWLKDKMDEKQLSLLN